MKSVFENKRGELQEFKPEDMLFELVNELDALWEYFGQTPNDTQLKDCVTVILSTYPAMDITLFKLAMTRIRSAYYGNDSKVYGKLNPQVVMTVLGRVWEEHERNYETMLAVNRQRYNDAAPLAFGNAGGEPKQLSQAIPEGFTGELVKRDTIAKFLEDRQRFTVVNQEQREANLTHKLSEKLAMKAEAAAAINDKRTDAIDKVLAYLQRHEPEEYNACLERLQQAGERRTIQI